MFFIQNLKSILNNKNNDNNYMLIEITQLLQNIIMQKKILEIIIIMNNNDKEQFLFIDDDNNINVNISNDYGMRILLNILHFYSGKIKNDNSILPLLLILETNKIHIRQKISNLIRDDNDKNISLRSFAIIYKYQFYKLNKNLNSHDKKFFIS